MESANKRTNTIYVGHTLTRLFRMLRDAKTNPRSSGGLRSDVNTRAGCGLLPARTLGVVTHFRHAAHRICCADGRALISSRLLQLQIKRRRRA